MNNDLLIENQYKHQSGRHEFFCAHSQKSPVRPSELIAFATVCVLGFISVSMIENLYVCPRFAMILLESKSEEWNSGAVISEVLQFAGHFHSGRPMTSRRQAESDGSGAQSLLEARYV
jgi:hypothetical protein